MLKAYFVNSILTNGTKDEVRWLEGINAYLAGFDLTPLSLRSGSDPVLQRLSAPPPPAVTEGPLISVLMPVHNSGPVLEHSVRSVLDQSWRNLELMICDDASTDNSWEILLRLAAEDNRIRLLQNPVRVGPHVSNNRAVHAASGDYLTLQDQHSWSHPARIARQVGAIAASDDPAHLAGAIRMDRAGRPGRHLPFTANSRDGVTVARPAALMIKTRFFDEVLGNWDGVRLEADRELIGRLYRFSRKKLPRYLVPLIFAPKAADPVDGWTSDLSKARRQYRRAMRSWHAHLKQPNLWLPFPQKERPFPAPPALLNAPEDISRALDGPAPPRRILTARIATITNCRFPGGNASSTIDELGHFAAFGFDPVLIHCPNSYSVGKTLTDRYKAWPGGVRFSHTFDRLEVDHVILRGPSTIADTPFAREVLPKIRAKHGHIVVNNSNLRPSGDPHHDSRTLFARADALSAESVEICPISPGIRAELEKARDGIPGAAPLSALDWNPTFDTASLLRDPKDRMSAPYTIGRHARDTLEKWPETAERIRQAYPDHPDIQVNILGGAEIPRAILEGLPANWTVHPYGSLPPVDYLSTLDAFVYFPHTSYYEAFGRTIVEAILAGRPCILPDDFRGTFGDLPLYTDPSGVHRMLTALAADDTARIAYLREAQTIAADRYRTTSLDSRFPDLFPEASAAHAPSLSDAALAYKHAIEAS
ncbi:glycosyltransferase [Aestuariibius sp. 2305UL40-4]|uniref:glycosyltransferase n=1 Tax=Aestuariibius violaceus TaxID=3234132 RepID=UPI00345EB9BB